MPKHRIVETPYKEQGVELRRNPNFSWKEFMRNNPIEPIISMVEAPPITQHKINNDFEELEHWDKDSISSRSRRYFERRIAKDKADRDINYQTYFDKL